MPYLGFVYSVVVCQCVIGLVCVFVMVWHRVIRNVLFLCVCLSARYRYGVFTV